MLSRLITPGAAPRLNELISVLRPNTICKSACGISVRRIYASYATRHQRHFDGRIGASHERYVTIRKADKQFVGGDNAPNRTGDVRILLISQSLFKNDDLVGRNVGTKPFCSLSGGVGRNQTARRGKFIGIHTV